ncbi:MAG: hypothetical protein IJP43_06050 [Oscillospiraceae bacterium]|nr:hypothetical protein [Oscillospiraceae bacterium]
MTIEKTIEKLKEIKTYGAGEEFEDALDTAVALLDALRLLKFNAYAITFILDEAERKEAERKEREKTAELECKNKEVLAMPIADLDLSLRSYNCLMRRGVATVGDIMALGSYEELCRTRNLGRKSAEEICSKLAQFGLKLGSEAQNG